MYEVGISKSQSHNAHNLMLNYPQRRCSEISLFEDLLHPQTIFIRAVSTSQRIGFNKGVKNALQEKWE